MRISALKDDPGYNEEATQRKGLEIYCNGEHIKTAHTADTDLGLVRYYEKDERGRIKTLEMHGVVEIKGL